MSLKYKKNNLNKKINFLKNHELSPHLCSYCSSMTSLYHLFIYNPPPLHPSNNIHFPRKYAK